MAPQGVQHTTNLALKFTRKAIYLTVPFFLSDK